ncbi:MAG: hypothetical protein ACT4PZ_20565 [Panacagrimonas sp.]
MQDQTSLPPGYEELEPFVEYWAGATNDIRWDRRSRAAMLEIRRYYDAMLPRADEALSYLEQFPLGDMPADATRLLRLLLSLPHAAMAVEFHRQPRAASSPFPHGMHIQPGPWPQGG